MALSHALILEDRDFVCYLLPLKNPSDFSPDLSGFGIYHEELSKKLWLRPAQTARTDT
jgi:hypothetical protein